MKIIAFCGAFNPPTQAHFHAAEQSLQATGADWVAFIPSQMRYIQNEQQKSFAFSDETRLSMLRCMIEQAGGEARARMRALSYELEADHQPRTYETLCWLRDTYPHAAPSLLMGSDKLPELAHDWRNIDEIMREFGLVVLSRNGDDVERMVQDDPFLRSYEACIQIVPGVPEATLSSTQIRQWLSEIEAIKQKIAAVVPNGVFPWLGIGDA